MAGHFSDGDNIRCQHYARFASHLGRTSFDIIYWLLFLLVIILLFAASWRYGRLVPRHHMCGVLRCWGLRVEMRQVR
jgi:hypothetical protein